MRLIGQAKLGFYPTPLTVVDDIIRILEIEGKSKVLDPCCGEGVALSMLQGAFPDIETYGVELDTERAAKSKLVATHVLNCDAIGEFRATNAAFDVLWENPPYDDDVKGDDKESQRTEKKFLEQHRRYLKDDGGILVYIIPFSILNKVKNILMRYAELKVIPFPEKEYQTFKQIVVIGKTTKYLTAELMKNNVDYLERIIATVPVACPYRVLEDTRTFKSSYATSATGEPLKTFYTSRIDPDEALKLIKNTPIERAFREFCVTKRMNTIRPLTDLGQGHVAMLIAAGMMDGHLKSDDGEELVVRGFVNESFQEREESDEDSSRTIRRKQYQIVVNAINLTTGEYVRII